MSPRPSRRTLLATCGSVLSATVAGCTSGSSGEPTSTSPPSDSAPTETSTAPETATRTARPTTVSCGQQELMPDVIVENDTDHEVTVTVRILAVTDSDERLVAERTYEAPAGAYVEEVEKLFESVKAGTDGRPRADYVAEASTASGASDRREVTTVASSPWNYAVMVRVHDEGLSVYETHFDPGPTANRNCY